MSIFEHRKPVAAQSSRDVLSTLRSTLEKLEAQADETPRMANLKRILTDRISQLERKSA